MTETLLYSSLFLFGLVFGSFANVVIWRFPRGESLSLPGSRCPQCGHPVRWYDNVPVVSWLFLRARCRDCGARISGRYPTVELLGGILWLAAGIQFGVSVQTVFAIAYYYLLLILCFIDIDTMRLPNPLVGMLAAAGFLGAVVSQVTRVIAVPLVSPASGAWDSPLVVALIGAVLSAGVALAIAAAYGSVRKAQGFGMGDVKLLGAMGLFLGPYGLMALFAGSAFGAVYGVAMILRGRGEGGRTKFAFGPFLALAGVLTTMFGPAVWGWYLSLLR